MKPTRPMNQAALTPDDSHGGHFGPSWQTVIEPLVKLPKPVTPQRESDKAFHDRIVADLSFIGLLVTTAILVVSFIVAWSH